MRFKSTSLYKKNKIYQNCAKNTVHNFKLYTYIVLMKSYNWKKKEFGGYICMSMRSIYSSERRPLNFAMQPRDWPNMANAKWAKHVSSMASL